MAANHPKKRGLNRQPVRPPGSQRQIDRNEVTKRRDIDAEQAIASRRSALPVSFQSRSLSRQAQGLVTRTHRRTAGSFGGRKRTARHQR